MTTARRNSRSQRAVTVSKWAASGLSISATVAGMVLAARSDTIPATQTRPRPAGRPAATASGSPAGPSVVRADRAVVPPAAASTVAPADQTGDQTADLQRGPVVISGRS